MPVMPTTLKLTCTRQDANSNRFWAVVSDKAGDLAELIGWIMPTDAGELVFSPNVEFYLTATELILIAELLPRIFVEAATSDQAEITAEAPMD